VTGDPLNPQASVPPPPAPPEPKGVDTISCGWGADSDDWRKSLALCLLWATYKRNTKSAIQMNEWMNRDRMRLILTLPRNGRSKENKDTMDYFGDRFRRQTEEISELQEKVNVLYICSQTFFPLFSIENGFSVTTSSVHSIPRDCRSCELFFFF
jgi:hypothetical protein